MRVEPHRPVQLRVDRVRKHFGGVTAVDDVSLEVRTGEILSIIGPNGAGKTSLLNMISGFYHPDQGRIHFLEEDISALAPSHIATRGIARTFQNIALFKGMTVLENLLLGRHIKMKTGVLGAVAYWPAQKEDRKQRETVDQLVELLALRDVCHMAAGVLPYGIQKRVELARALALEPHMLLLDEPMGGMNQKEKGEMVGCILEINERRGTTVVLIEHDMGVVMDISERVVVLDRGRVIASGSPSAVQADPHVVRAYLGVGAHQGTRH